MTKVRRRHGTTTSIAWPSTPGTMNGTGRQTSRRQVDRERQQLAAALFDEGGAVLERHVERLRPSSTAAIAEVEHEAAILVALVAEADVRRVGPLERERGRLAGDAEVGGDQRAVVAQDDLAEQVGLRGDALRGVLVGLGLLGRVALPVGGDVVHRLVGVSMSRSPDRAAATPPATRAMTATAATPPTTLVSSWRRKATRKPATSTRAATMPNAAGPPVLRQGQHDPAERVDDDRRAEGGEHRELGGWAKRSRTSRL